ncbi:DCC family protein At1g52590, chloroplastic [Dioscorea cayenensis subsp. rotundata]|uniref:DCC family protein At1g52590, chloroplastic n=1 Tax=Dioscorea cayennensis subsp. rotundata TaxID=55577 RepID=A0AB40CW37_DIOCR|nr:DCC family protein At1g52590, chloroplastic [Dioscorea cayenensis subsp. rotundata]
MVASSMALFLPALSACAPAVRANGRHMRYAAVAPHSSSSSSRGVDWVKSTDAEYFQEDTRPIMLFDGVCNLCNGGVRFVRDNDHNRRIRYEALQSESGKKLLRRSGRSPDDISSVVLVEKDKSYIKSEAVLKIMEYLQVPFPQFALFFRLVPLFIRDIAYDNVANNRYTLFGRSDTDSCQI